MGKLKTLKYEITGTTPYLQGAPNGMYFFDPQYKERIERLKVLRSVADKKRTEEQRFEILRIEWELQMYHDEELGPYIPSRHIEATIQTAAAASKKKTTAKSAMLCKQEKVPIEYDGPRDVEGLWDKGYRSVGTVKGTTGSRTVYCYPVFDAGWKANFEIEIDTDSIGEAELDNFVVAAGKTKGIGAWRPKHGRFEVKRLK